MRARVGRLLRRWADRIDPGHAPKLSGWSFTYERAGASGSVMQKRTDGRGCPLWLFQGPDVVRAFDEADSDWRSPSEKLADMLATHGEPREDQ